MKIIIILLCIICFVTCFVIPFYQRSVANAKMTEAKADISAIITEAKIRAQEHFATTSEQQVIFTRTPVKISEGNYTHISLMRLVIDENGEASGIITVSGHQVTPVTWRDGHYQAAF